MEHKLMKKISKLYDWTLSKLFYNDLPKDWIPDKTYLKWVYRVKIGRNLHLKNPKTFTEKVQWLKIYDRRPEYTTMVDKYAVKKYVADKIGEQYVIPTLGGPWKSFDEIDFDALPEQFVLKTTHDSGGIAICKDKATFDKEAAKKKLEEHLKNRHWKKWREWAYKDVPPQIIAEKYMSDGSLTTDGEEQLTDYKIFCFNGKPSMLFIATDRFSKEEETKFDFFDMDGNHLPFKNVHPHADPLPKMPKSLPEMKVLAEKLSEGITQCRIDFYEINGKIYFGEVTMYHYAGLTTLSPDEWDYKIGEMIELPKK